MKKSRLIVTIILLIVFIALQIIRGYGFWSFGIGFLAAILVFVSLGHWQYLKAADLIDKKINQQLS